MIDSIFANAHRRYGASMGLPYETSGTDSLKSDEIGVE
jgi:hypothetical protein